MRTEPDDTRRDGEWWLQGRPFTEDDAEGPAHLPPHWRPLPSAVAVLLLLAMGVVALLVARDARDVGEHLTAFTIAGGGSVMVLLLARFLLRRRPARTSPFADVRGRRALLFGPLPLAALVFWALGLPPEDGALTVVPVVFLADEALIAAGLARPAGG